MRAGHQNDRPVISAERLTKVLDWSHDVLGPAHVAVARAGVEETASSMYSLDGIREHVTTADELYTRAAEDVLLRAREYSLVTSARSSHGVALAEKLTVSTLEEALALASTASYLAIPLENTPYLEAYMVPISRVAEQVLRTRTEAGEEEADASLATVELLRAANDLRNACSSLEVAAKEAKNAERAKRRDEERAANMTAKAAQYENEARQLKQVVRSSGITADITHDAVLEISRETEKLEAQSRELDARISVYQGLPISETLAFHRLDELRREIAELDEDINASISGILV